MPHLKKGITRLIWDKDKKEYREIYEPRTVVVWTKEELQVLRQKKIASK